MPRKSNQPLEKVTIRLYAGDKEKLEDIYPTLGHNKVIRELVRNSLKQIAQQVELNKTTGVPK